MSGAGLPCSVPGCGARRGPELPLCRGHWRLVPAALRARVAGHYRFGQSIEPALQDWPWTASAGRAAIAAIQAAARV